MCLKVCVSVVAFYIVCFFSLTDGFFLPVFVRKQHPQSPALNNAQWSSYQSSGALTPLSNPAGSSPGSSSAAYNLNTISSSTNPNQPIQQISPSTTYKEYSPFQQQQQQSLVTPLHQVPLSPIQTQYSYEPNGLPYHISPYSQYQSAFHSVQLVPCLCPITKEVIDQQSQQYQHAQQIQGTGPQQSAQGPVEAGSNEVLIKGSQKVTS